MSKEDKAKKFYYYDKDNDIIEYIEGNEDFFACWVNPHLTLLFPHDCTELISKNIIGFQINEMRHIIQRAGEQATIPLTPEQESEFKEAGF